MIKIDIVKILPKYRVNQIDKITVNSKKKNNKKKTTEEYKEEVSKVNSNIKVLGEYVNSKTKILHKCLNCNNEYLAYPSNVLRGHGCQKCSLKNLTNSIIGKKSKLRKSHEDFIAELKMAKPTIEILDTYITAEHSNNYRCLVCGNIWSCRPYAIIHGKGCPKCNPKNLPLKQSHDDFIKVLESLNVDVTLLSQYTRSDEKVIVKCNKCGRIWSIIAHNLTQGHGCKCNNIKINEDEFWNRLHEKNIDIKILSNYNNDNKFFYCQCNKCKNIWYTNKYRLLRNQGCPNCRTPKGERIITALLNDYNISFTAQKTFNDLLGVGGKKLSYDFYLHDYNLLIEFQGKQHEQANEYFGGEEQFKIQQEHDKRKREYAEQNNINLLEIWYYDIDNIKSILLQKIKEINENNLKLESVETVTVA